MPEQDHRDATPPTALGHLRVIELTGTIAGAYAGKLLADLGADVIKVEPPGGDSLRWRGVSPKDGDEARGSAFFQHLHTNKRGVLLDLTTSLGGELLEQLCQTAQVVIDDGTSVRPGGEDQARLLSQGPGVIVSLSPFGSTGPYAGIESSGLTLQAAAAWVSRRGQVEMDPVQVGGDAHEFVGGVYSAAAALTAWRLADQSQAVVEVEVPLMECVFNTTAYPMLRRETLLELGFARTRYTAYIPGVLRCQDGWVAVNCLTGQHWHDLCAVLGVPDYADGYADMRYDGSQMDSFYSRIQPWFDERGQEEIVQLFQLFRVPASPIGTGENMPGFEQYAAREFFRRDPTDSFMVPGPPYRLSETPPRVRRVSPRLGEHTGEVPRPSDGNREG